MVQLNALLTMREVSLVVEEQNQAAAILDALGESAHVDGGQVVHLMTLRDENKPTRYSTYIKEPQ